MAGAMSAERFAESVREQRTLGDPRLCPSCHGWHPIGTTCAGGWRPWAGEMSEQATQPTWTLDAADYQRAVDHATAVVAHAIRRRYRMKFDAEKVGETRLGVNIRGFAGELAAHRVLPHLELRWLLLGPGYTRKAKDPDLGQRVDVKTPRSETGSLTAHVDDRRDFVFLLVTPSRDDDHRFTLRGWVEGRRLLTKPWWRGPRDDLPGAYVMGQSELAPLPLPADA